MKKTLVALWLVALVSVVAVPVSTSILTMSTPAAADSRSQPSPPENFYQFTSSGISPDNVVMTIHVNDDGSSFWEIEYR
ncbi:MAG: hypothetical protein SXQ77_08990, partial [Halobacteria archaeon]|nr:hypothetical protein [Halobacteria archaeon]